MSTAGVLIVNLRMSIEARYWTFITHIGAFNGSSHLANYEQQSGAAYCFICPSSSSTPRSTTFRSASTSRTTSLVRQYSNCVSACVPDICADELARMPVFWLLVITTIFIALLPDFLFK